MLAITNKKDNQALLDRGALGNHVRHWQDREALEDSGYRGPVTLRYRAAGPVAGSRRCAYNVPYGDVDDIIDEWVAGGAEADRVYFNEWLPDDRLVLQGEASRTTFGLYLNYTTVRKPMRAALAEESLHAEGLAAVLLLKGAMDPASYDDLEALLDRYEDHQVEFSAYSRPVGELPGRGTIFWEVRRY